MLEPLLDPDVVSNEIDLLAAAIHIDRYVMNAMGRLGEDFSEIDALTMQTFNQLSGSKHLLNDKVLRDKETPCEGLTRNLEKITVYNEQMEEKANSPASRLRRLCSCCDRSFSYYSTIAEIHTSEAVKLMAKKLLVAAQKRIEILKQALGKECGCEI